MNINYLAILLATVLQFIFGAVWYGAFFGKLWGKIHGFDKLPKEKQQELMKGMGILYLVQFIVTLITTFILAIFLAYVPDWNAYALAGFCWLGFIVPAQVSSVLFSNTDPKYRFQKILLQTGAALGCLEIAAIVLHLM